MAQWSTACPDWENRLINGQGLIPFPPLYPEESQAGNDVLRQLKIVDIAGHPTFGEACGEWVFEFSGAVFGSYDSESGRREIKEFELLIPKKNMKSTLAAGIMLTLLIRNWRTSAELIILAPTKEVADNSFNPCRDMIRHDEDLSSLLHVQEHIKTITHRGTGATLKVVAADSNTVGGKKASYILVDELHLFGSMANAENMLREATGGLASRPEGCIIYLTTQSDKPPAGVFLNKLQYGRNVRDGVIVDKRFLPVLYEFPKSILDNDGHKEFSNFGLVNPNLGRSVDVEFLERGYQVAIETGQESVNGFMAKHLNVEVGVALMNNRWPGAEFWEKTANKEITREYILQNSEVIAVGIDGGGLDDLLGLTIIGRHQETKQWLSWSMAWAHSSVLERRKSEAARLKDMARDGDLVIVERAGQDIDELVEIVSEVHALELLDKIGVDPAGIGSILDALDAANVPSDRVVGVSQGWKLGGAIKTAERKLADGTLAHADQPLMNWCVGNARLEQRANGVLITKQVSGSAKIDPLMAFFAAATLMGLNPASAKKKFQMFVV
jgi:phage terminase large subunit-like protein